MPKEPFAVPKGQSLLLPSITYRTPAGEPGRILIAAGLIAAMETALDTAIAAARADGGTALAIEVTRDSSLLVRRQIT